MKLQLNTNKTIPKRSLGQNFITDKKFLKKLSSFIQTNEQDVIIEIGPGKGALTHYLAKKKFKKLILIEKDRKLASDLKKIFINNKRIIVETNDALKFSYCDYYENKNTIIVGNLPFNISSQLLFKWLDNNEWPPFYKRLILMFQKELADRIISKPDNKNYGRISVAAQARCDISKLLYAPARIFNPMPKVDGLVLDFKPSLQFKDLNYKKLQIILKKAFSARRKKIKTNLNNYLDSLHELNIDTNLRAENLSVLDYCELTSIS